MKANSSLRKSRSQTTPLQVVESRKAPSVLDRLKKLIHAQGLQPGMKLAAERDLATKLSVGRPAIREAIKSLTSLDVLESHRGDGTYIKSLRAISGDSSSLTLPGNSQLDLIELLELRKIIEPRAAALAAARATPRQIRRMESELRAQERQVGDLNAFAVHDYQFHHEVLSAAGNRLIEQIEEMFSPLLRKSRSITIQTTPSIDVVCEQHRTIFNAIRLGESQLAERAMFDHLQGMGVDLISGKRR